MEAKNRVKMINLIIAHLIVLSIGFFLHGGKYRSGVIFYGKSFILSYIAMSTSLTFALFYTYVEKFEAKLTVKSLLLFIFVGFLFAHLSAVVSDIISGIFFSQFGWERFKNVYFNQAILQGQFLLVIGITLIVPLKFFNWLYGALISGIYILLKEKKYIGIVIIYALATLWKILNYFYI